MTAKQDGNKLNVEAAAVSVLPSTANACPNFFYILSIVNVLSETAYCLPP